ncbi:hypothetical protein HDU96_005839 [Phlyctochytrium bullatum]|nr:hypothetical protein HDU96_005839 [Phlyctochytrium bullatum]
MSKVIVVAGYGPGISNGVAAKFSKTHKVALLARTQEKLDKAAKDLSASGATVKGFAVDLSDPTAVKKTISDIRTSFGTIDILFWNPSPAGALLLNSTPEQLHSSFNLQVVSLVAAVQAALDDLKANKGAVLVTGGGLSLENEYVVKTTVEWNFSTTVSGKAAQRKTVNLLNEELKSHGVYAGEVTVLGAVKGTPFDNGSATITSEAVAEKFNELYTKRDKVFDQVA